MVPSRREAIANFLAKNTVPDLAELYTPAMECQVIVAQDDGEIISGEFRGTKWRGYQDDYGNIWKPFRIPFGSMSEPHYEDSEMTYDLQQHAEGVGMTGWDWENLVSRWVAFDFDSIIGHKDAHQVKMTPQELDTVQREASSIPWVTVRRSTGGRGLHLYVMLDAVPTKNHSEHAALARSILSQMSGLAGFDFSAKVDICGGNMWVWHRKMAQSQNALELIKQGEVLMEPPKNWRDHINVVSGRQSKVNPSFNVDAFEKKFDRLSGQNNMVPLEKDHKDLIKWLHANDKYFWWSSDNHMLVCHTLDLKEAHECLNFDGVFETSSTGSTSHNCFCFPMRRGSWSVRRFSPGCSEHPSWDQDGQGWTKCFLNRPADLKTASYEGLEDPKGGYIFQSGDGAARAALILGADLNLPIQWTMRPGIKIDMHKDGKRIVVSVPKETTTDPNVDTRGWLDQNKTWTKIFTAQIKNDNEINLEDYDDVTRHAVTSADSNAGWVIYSDGRWTDEPLDHIKSALRTLGLTPNDVTQVIGASIFKPWRLVVEPFKEEYPGGRKWNRFAPQLRFTPSTGEKLHYPTWTKIFEHVGANLTPGVKYNDWCRSSGVLTGADWLKCWVASMFQHPEQPLPYIFLYSSTQDTGKSTLHEALSMLFSPGYVRADVALKSGVMFNGELEGAILCVVEETNLKENKSAGDRIKDWVTARELPIHKKMLTPYTVPNTTHWIQCANEVHACPIFPGDTRITMIDVRNAPEHKVPKEQFMNELAKEAPDFLAEMFRLEIPPTDGRLRIPCIETQEKIDAANANRSPAELWMDEYLFHVPGQVIRLSDMWDRFRGWIDPAQLPFWSNRKLNAIVNRKFPKGRLKGDPNWHFGNCSFDPDAEPGELLEQYGDQLR